MLGVAILVVNSLIKQLQSPSPGVGVLGPVRLHQGEVAGGEALLVSRARVCTRSEQGLDGARAPEPGRHVERAGAVEGARLVGQNHLACGGVEAGKRVRVRKTGAAYSCHT